MASPTMTPELAASFDAAAQAQTTPSAAAMTPDLAASFDAAAKAQDRGALGTVGGYGSAVLSGVNEGLGRAAGIPVDLSNLLGAGLREGPAWALDKAGATGAGDWVRKNLFPPIYTGSGQSFVDALQKSGISQPAGTPGEQAAKDLTSTLTTGATSGLLAPGAGMAGAISGAGGALGAEAAHKINDATGQHVSPVIADLIGAILGGKVSGRIGNRTINYSQTPEMAEMEAAGVKPRLPSDVNPEAGAPAGTRNASVDSARKTQSEIGNFVDRSLPNTGESTQELGTSIQQAAERKIQSLKDETNAAYDDVRTTVPATTPIDMTSTKSALQTVMDRAGGNPTLEQVVANPTLTRLAPLAKLNTLSFDQMNLLRQEIGQSMNSPSLTGAEQGLLRQVYKGLNDDITHSLSADPAALEKYNKASQTWQHNSDLIADLQKNVTEKAAPETIPGWVAQQAKLGGSRVGALADVMTPEQQGMLLRNAGMKDGRLDLDQLMKFYQGASPEAQAALTRDPAAAAAMAQAQRMYQATAGGRSLAGNAPDINELRLGNKVSGLGEIAHGAFSLNPAKVAVGMGQLVAGPAIEKGADLATRAWQGSGRAARMATPVNGSMVDPTMAGRYGALGGASQSFPDIYTPPPAAPQPPSGGQVQSWLGSADRQTGTAYIASRLGPQVAQQLGATDATGYKAALFGLFARPEYRQALAVNNNEGSSNND